MAFKVTTVEETIDLIKEIIKHRDDINSEISFLKILCNLDKYCITKYKDNYLVLLKGAREDTPPKIEGAPILKHNSVEIMNELIKDLEKITYAPVNLELDKAYPKTISARRVFSYPLFYVNSDELNNMTGKSWGGYRKAINHAKDNLEHTVKVYEGLLPYKVLGQMIDMWDAWFKTQPVERVKEFKYSYNLARNFLMNLPKAQKVLGDLIVVTTIESIGGEVLAYSISEEINSNTFYSIEAKVSDKLAKNNDLNKYTLHLENQYWRKRNSNITEINIGTGEWNPNTTGNKCLRDERPLTDWMNPIYDGNQFNQSKYFMRPSRVILLAHYNYGNYGKVYSSAGRLF